MTKAQKTADQNEGIDVFLPQFVARFDRAADDIERKLDMLTADRPRTLLHDLPIRLIGVALIGISTVLCALPIVLAITAY